MQTRTENTPQNKPTITPRELAQENQDTKGKQIQPTDSVNELAEEGYNLLAAQISLNALRAQIDKAHNSFFTPTKPINSQSASSNEALAPELKRQSAFRR